MNRTALIRSPQQMSESFTMRTMTDLKQLSLLQPNTNGGNHPLRTMGHLAYLEGGIYALVTDIDHPTKHWAPLFAPSTLPLLDSGRYPSIDMLIASYQEFRTKNIKALNEMDDAAIDRRPKHVPPGFEDAMRTIGRMASQFERPKPRQIAAYCHC